MHSRQRQNRLCSLNSSILALFLAMLSTVAALYVAGLMWQDAEARVHLIQELDKSNSQLVHNAVSVEDTLKIIACREQNKRLSTVETELAAARKEGFVTKNEKADDSRKRILAVVGIFTTFGRKKNREAIRMAWMPTGASLNKLADEKGIILRFVIGRSPNRGDSLDKQIDRESSQNKDFFILDDQVEAPEEGAKKMKSFFVQAVESWDAEFYVKVNDDLFLNMDVLGATLTAYLNKPRVYIGCMKSGDVFSEPTSQWYEPDWWKFGDAKSYPRHASGEIYAISRALAQFVSINRPLLHTYAHDDVTAGSWFIGIDVEHIYDRKFCCLGVVPGAICTAV